MKAQLYFLHFAGGSKYSYNFLLPYLTQFEVHCLELPGRGKRLNEKLLTNADEAVEDYYQQIVGKLDTEKFALFGHSMGAALMPALVHRLENAKKHPFYVFVSGNPGPGILKNKNRHLLSADEFKQELADYGGMPPGLMQDEDLFDFFEPILRADFQIVEKSADVPSPIISAPVLAMMGREELHAEQIGNWRAYTTGLVNCKLYKGKHFFIYDQPTAIAELINACHRTI